MPSLSRVTWPLNIWLCRQDVCLKCQEPLTERQNILPHGTSLLTNNAVRTWNFAFLILSLTFPLPVSCAPNMCLHLSLSLTKVLCLVSISLPCSSSLLQNICSPPAAVLILPLVFLLLFLFNVSVQNFILHSISVHSEMSTKHVTSLVIKLLVRCVDKILYVVDKKWCYYICFITLLIDRYSNWLLAVLRQFLLIPISVWVSEWIVLPPALIISAGIWSVPSELCIVSFSTCKALGSNTSGSTNMYLAVSISVDIRPDVCLLVLQGSTVKNWQQLNVGIFLCLRERGGERGGALYCFLSLSGIPWYVKKSCMWRSHLSVCDLISATELFIGFSWNAV